MLQAMLYALIINKAVAVQIKSRHKKLVIKIVLILQDKNLGD
jgi:hypothetical protein